MRKASDFAVAFVIALLLHVAGGYCAGSILGIRVGLVKPVFKPGESSVELTLLPPLVTEEKARVEQVIVQPPEPDVPPMQVIDEIKQPEEPVKEELNADLLEKGVEQAEPYSASQIRPDYPYGSRIRGEEGAVVLSVVLDESGRAVDVVIVTSSGYHSLDRAAVKAIRKARFMTDDGTGMSGRQVDYTFRFQLKE